MTEGALGVGKCKPILILSPGGVEHEARDCNAVSSTRPTAKTGIITEEEGGTWGRPLAVRGKTLIFIAIRGRGG